MLTAVLHIAWLLGYFGPFPRTQFLPCDADVLGARGAADLSPPGWPPPPFQVLAAPALCCLSTSLPLFTSTLFFPQEIKKLLSAAFCNYIEA